MNDLVLTLGAHWAAIVGAVAAIAGLIFLWRESSRSALDGESDNALLERQVRMMADLHGNVAGLRASSAEFALRSLRYLYVLSQLVDGPDRSGEDTENSERRSMRAELADALLEDLPAAEATKMSEDDYFDSMRSSGEAATEALIARSAVSRARNRVGLGVLTGGTVLLIVGTLLPILEVFGSAQ